MATVNYNERSWAIDVISEINLFLSKKSWHLKSAGGENTITNNKSSLFPDILLFKDLSKEYILQGWELKMPDTPINDSELINNAIKKAKILQKGSFILWNVKSARLYIKSNEKFEILKSWNDISINSRSEVKGNESHWKALLHIILSDLNDYFESGKVSDIICPEILAVDAVIDVILENVIPTTDNLKRRILNNSTLDAEINRWWLSSATEYGYNPTNEKEKQYKYQTLSKVILTDWVIKIIFANILKRHFNEARVIEKINNDTTIDEGKQIVLAISERCDFWNIFSDNLPISNISESAWKQIIQLNQFLSTINLKEINIELLHNLLESSIVSVKRKVAGQFATPKKLAELLVRLTLENKEGYVFDTCCGTGTIINEAYLLKEEYGINKEAIIESIWASDKYSFPLQLTTLTLSRPDNIGKILNIFREDLTNLHIGQTIGFRNPNNGIEIQKSLPTVKYIVTNLPFIKSEVIKKVNPEISAINSFIKKLSGNNRALSNKGDIFTYIPFYFYQLLEDNGKIGLILSNAWLGTDYGKIFIELIQRFFDIEIVLISGNGKWFYNANVVTTLLVATKRNPAAPIISDRKIFFCTLNEKIEKIENIKNVSDSIILKSSSEYVTVQPYSLSQINAFQSIGIPWSGYFSNMEWLISVSDKLLDCNRVFDFIRGERRGWNALFYPSAGHTIEPEYIKPVLRNLRSTKGLYSVADAEAFCCSKSIGELQVLNHIGALNWIKSFEYQTNEKEIPLTKSLRRSNMHWYEMKTNNMVDFVANINYDRSLFITTLQNRSFIDQRMIGLLVKSEYKQEDRLLLLALLNSVLSMFFIESFGFGRGLSALDLREKKFKRDFKILNPALLSNEQKEYIISAFQPISKRNRYPLEQEIEQEDRIYFENVMFRSFGITQYYNPVTKSLKHLYRIRFAPKNIN